MADEEEDTEETPTPDAETGEVFDTPAPERTPPNDVPDVAIDEFKPELQRTDEDVLDIPENGTRVDGDEPAIPDVSVTGQDPGFPFGPDHDWGILSISGANVTIAPGEFDTLETAKGTLTIMDDASYIGLEYDPAGTLTVMQPNTAKPVSGDGTFRKWMYFFKLVGTGDTAQAVYVRHNLTGIHAALYAASAGS